MSSLLNLTPGSEIENSEISVLNKLCVVNNVVVDFVSDLKVDETFVEILSLGIVGCDVSGKVVVIAVSIEVETFFGLAKVVEFVLFCFSLHKTKYGIQI